MPDNTKEKPVKPAVNQPDVFPPEHVQQVQEAIRRAERDMADWREKSRVDPIKLKEPMTR